MNLAVDIGNSRAKAAVFSGGEIVERWCSESFGSGELEAILAGYPGIRRSILSSTRDGNMDIEQFLYRRTERFIRFTPDVGIPLKNKYATPATLGPDRLSAAVGASHIYPGKNILLVDFGTAMTVDIITADGEYLGGNISPGARTRFRALNDYTSRLPLGAIPCGDTYRESLTGTNTVEAIESGVINGIVFELEGYIGRYGDRFGEVTVIFTGGDADFFAKRLKNTIFANQDLVLIGLNTILEYNANQ